MRMPRYDEIGYWSEIKLEIISKYATAYSTIMAANPVIKCHLYIDAFVDPVSMCPSNRAK